MPKWSENAEWMHIIITLAFLLAILKHGTLDSLLMALLKSVPKY